MTRRHLCSVESIQQPAIGHMSQYSKLSKSSNMRGNSQHTCGRLRGGIVAGGQSRFSSGNLKKAGINARSTDTPASFFGDSKALVF